MNFTVSICKNAKDTITVAIYSAGVLADIKSGRWLAQIDEIRRMYTKGGKSTVKALKCNLPGILWSGQFSQRNVDGLTQYSGLLVADLDELGDQLPRVRDQLMLSPHVYAVFRSPTWSGLKAVFRVPADAQLHVKSFEAVREHVRALCGSEIDPSGKDVTRLCFVSYDPETFVNPNTVTELTVPSHGESLGVIGGECCTDSQTHRRTDLQTHMTLKSVCGEGSWVIDFLPTKAHETNTLFFNMARKSRSVERSQGRPLSLQELWQSFKTWFDNSRPEFLSESLQSYFEEFCRIRSYVRTPLDESPLQLAWRRANSEPMPPESSHLSEPVRKLLALCAQLQLLEGKSSFYLSSHSAAEFLGVVPNQAYRWLRSLEGQGLLRCEKRGDPVKRLATEYRYTGSLPTSIQTAI